MRFGPSSFGIFDALPDTRVARRISAARWDRPLGENTGELFEQPTIEPVDVIAEKPPA